MKNGEKITEEEAKKLEYEELLKQDISIDEKNEVLMGLLFDEEEEKTYKERYEKNKELSEKECIMSKVKFGKVDFEENYKETQIPEDIISKMNLNEEERQVSTKTEELEDR